MLEHVILGAVRALLFVRACMVAVVHWMIFPMTLIKTLVLNRIASGHQQRHIRRLHRTLATTEDYQTWWLTAKRLDVECGYKTWSEDNRSVYYDAEALARSVSELQRWLGDEDPLPMTYKLRSVVQRNLRNVPHHVLFPYQCGTKKLLEQYVVQVITNLEVLYGSQKLSLATRAEFFQDALRTYGRTALILSGGSALGLYHLGVLKALCDAELLPSVICGTKLGACLAALVCTRRDKQMASLFSLADVDMDVYERLKHDRAAIRARLSMFFHEGTTVDVHNLKAFMCRDFGDMTFKEAYAISQRVLNVTVWNVPGAPIVFNYITTPDVVVWSAVCMSINPKAADMKLMEKQRNGLLVPFAIPSQRWTRGGETITVVADTPTNALAQLFDVNFHIVSQTQAYVVPFLLLKQRYPVVYSKPSFLIRMGLIVLFFVLRELHHQLVQLIRWFHLTPNSALHVALTQQYEGDITIVPVGTIEDYLAILHVPSKEHTEQCQVNGCRRAWPYMTMVMYHSLIERRLEKCLVDLKTAIRISDEAQREPPVTPFVAPHPAVFGLHPETVDPEAEGEAPPSPTET